jgi:phospholipid/cholesterol/gamma-HCH transport system permease protein
LPEASFLLPNDLMWTRLLDTLNRLGTFAIFTGQALLSLPAGLLRPGAVWQQLCGVLLGTLPLALVAGAALGIVSWLQIRGLLFNFRSEALLPGALALAVVRGVGPVIAGLIAAGRVGAGLGAEIGSLRISEQVDALRVLGVSPMSRLVAPRVMACMIALPLLTLFVDYLAILSSYAAEAVGGSLTWTEYRLEVLRYLRLVDVLPATLKTVVFGFWIGASGCYWGLEATGGTEGVGKAATRAVVLATLLVLVSDVVMVRLLQMVIE